MSFAAGVMLSAAVAGLILPSLAQGGRWAVPVTISGILCGAAFLLLANVIFQSPIQDLNTFAAAVVSVLFLVVGLTIISGCQNPILVRHRLHKAGLYNHEGQAPWLIRQSRDPDNKKIMLLEFENQGIPRETWQEQKEAQAKERKRQNELKKTEERISF